MTMTCSFWSGMTITTVHDASSVDIQRISQSSPSGTEEISKPYAKTVYNNYVGGINKLDQFVSYYTIT